eukprot:gene49272-59787_t
MFGGTEQEYYSPESGVTMQVRTGDGGPYSNIGVLTMLRRGQHAGVG